MSTKAGTDPASPDVPADLTAAIHIRVASLAADYLDLVGQRSGQLPVADYDPEWPSPCVVGQPRDGQCVWQPSPMTPTPDFGRLEAALEVSIHPAVKAVYTAHWSAPLPLRYHDNEFELLQLWNDQDLDNLFGNFIGHALEKKRIRQELTLFFALVDDNQLLSIDNATGAVMLEVLGQPRPQEVAESLLEFLHDCVACDPVV